MIEAGVTYICDRGYFSFKHINTLHHVGAFFVLRLKKNYKTTCIKVLEITGEIPSCFTHVSDNLVRFNNNTANDAGEMVRIVRFCIAKTHFVICTNRLDLTTLNIILLYAYRWQIELLFKFLKRSVNAIHLFSNTKNGSKVYLCLMLTFVLLQIALKQKCHKIVNNSTKIVAASPQSAQPRSQDYHSAPDWVYEMGLKFKNLFKSSINWLTYLKNSIAQLFDYDIAMQLANL